MTSVAVTDTLIFSFPYCIVSFNIGMNLCIAGGAVFRLDLVRSTIRPLDDDLAGPADGTTAACCPSREDWSAELETALS